MRKVLRSFYSVAPVNRKPMHEPLTEQFPLASFVVKTADPRERVCSLETRETSYREFFGSGGIDFHDRSVIQLVALLADEVVAGARIVGPTPLPLDIASVAGGLWKTASGSLRVAQLGGLWFHSRYRRVSIATVKLCRRLFRKAWEIGTRLGAAAFVLRTSEARMTKWYGALGFVPVPECDYHDPVWGKVFTMVMPLTGKQLTDARGATDYMTNETQREP